MSLHDSNIRLESLLESVKKHLVDSTAIYASSTPIYTLFENVVLGMSDNVSMSARATTGVLTYLGMGFAISKGRDISKGLFGIDNSSSGRAQTFHDAAYLTGFTTVVSPFVYAVSGASLEENVAGTLTAMALAIPVGPIIGYAVEVFRDLTEIEESRRVPETIKRAPPTIKRCIAGALVAAFLGSAGLIYYVTPDKEISRVQEQRATESRTDDDER